MRILVCGSRGWTDYKLVEEEIGKIAIGRNETVVVHGAAPGADFCAGAVARALGLREERHPANWAVGKWAGSERNQKMANLGADVCLAFWDGRSRGTLDMIQRAVQAGIPVRIVPMVRR